jgi:hypothetical protein
MEQCWDLLKTQGEKGYHVERPLYTPKISSLMYILYDQKLTNYLSKRCLQHTPRKCIYEWILLVLLSCQMWKPCSWH